MHLRSNESRAEDENEEKKDEDLADGEEKKHKPKVDFQCLLELIIFCW